jgi:predicted lactoylglutathione lyase
MIGHIGFYVEDLNQSNPFYPPLLKIIGYETLFSLPQCIAYGTNVPLFEIYTGKPKSTGIHVAFHVASKKIVDEFHAVALSIGAKDNGVPGYRSYFPNYYAAFVIDPNWHNLEALFWDSDK